MLLGSCLFLHSHPHSCCCLSWAFLSFSSVSIFLSMSVAFSVLQAHSHSQLLTFISSSLLLPWCKVISMLSHLYLPKLFLRQRISNSPSYFLSVNASLLCQSLVCVVSVHILALFPDHASERWSLVSL